MDIVYLATLGSIAVLMGSGPDTPGSAMKGADEGRSRRDLGRVVAAGDREAVVRVGGRVMRDAYDLGSA